jgi:hypothetical protein
MRWFGEKEIIVKLFSKLCSHENDAMLLIDETGYILAGNGAYSQEKGHPLPPEAYLSDFFPMTLAKTSPRFNKMPQKPMNTLTRSLVRKAFPIAAVCSLLMKAPDYGCCV